MTRPLRGAVIRAGRSIGLYAAGGLATSVVGFLALPVFTRLFTTEEFGVIGLFTAAIGLLAPLMSLGSYVFILYDSADPGDRAGVPGSVMALATLGALILTVVGVGVGVVTDLPITLVLLAVCTSWANVWILTRLHAFQSAEQPGRYFLLSAVVPLAGFVATVLLASRIDGWGPRVYALTLAAGFGACWSAFSLVRGGLIDWSRAVARIKEVASFGAPLVVHTASIWVVGFTDRFFVAELDGLDAAGIYTVAYAIGLGVAAAHDGVSRFFVSQLARWVMDHDGRGKASRFSYWYTAAAVATLPVVVPLSILGLRLLAAESYGDGADLLIWLVPAQALAGIARVFTGYLYIEKRTRQRAVLSAGEALLNVALTWLLVASLGMVGAAIATLLTYAASAIATFVMARRGPTLQSIAQSLR